MDYYNAPPDPAQNQPLEPHSIISGSLPGATEIRIGNNIKISGKNQQIEVTTTGGNVVIGATSDGRLALEATNTDGSKVGIGNIPGTTNLGLYSVDSSSHTTAVLGKQADGSNSLKFFDANNLGLAQFGKYADGTTALKVAKTNVEVGTATNDQLIFNSSQDIFKIIAKGTSSIPAFTTNTGGSHFSIVTIPHNQFFTPLVNVYVSGQLLNFNTLATIAASYIPLPIITGNGVDAYYFPATDGSSYPLSILYTADSTNIYVEAFSRSTSGTQTTVNAIPITYFVLQETAT